MDTFFVCAAYLFGVLLVGCYAWSSFNAPPYAFAEERRGNDNGRQEDGSSYGALASPGLPRYMTEGLRYRTFRGIFVTFAVVLFVLLAQLLPIIPGIDGLVQIHGGSQMLREAAKAMASALLLIGVVGIGAANIGKIKIGSTQIEPLMYLEWPRKLLFDSIKGLLHQFANIPETGRNLFEALCYEQVDYESNVAKAHIESILQRHPEEAGRPRRDLDESDFKGGSARSINWKWARLSYGIEVVRNWQDQPLFARQLLEQSLGWPRLQQRYIDTIDDVIRYRQGQLDEEKKVELNLSIEQLFANCHRLIACLVIMVAKPGEDPFRYIGDEGYRVIPGNRFSVKSGESARIAMAIIPTIVLIAATALLFTHDKESIRETVVHVVHYVGSGLIIFALPIYIVLTAKRLMSLQGSWPTVTKDTPYSSFFEMPLPTYSALSLLAFVLSTVLMMIIIDNAHLDSLGSWRSMSVFCLISAVTAFFTAYRTDTPPRVYGSRLTYYFSRAKGAVLQGILTATIAWLGLILYAPKMETSKLVLFTLMGFGVAAVVNLTLFQGKHHFEKRGSPREHERKDVSAVVAGVTVQAKLLNRSATGASLYVGRNHTVPSDSEIELIVTDHDQPQHLFGRVVRSGDGKMQIRFIPQQTGEPAVA